MSFIKRVWRLLVEPKPTNKTQRSLKLLLIHNLDLTENEMYGLKSHLAIEVEAFLEARIADRDIQKIALLEKRGA